MYILLRPIATMFPSSNPRWLRGPVFFNSQCAVPETYFPEAATENVSSTRVTLPCLSFTDTVSLPLDKTMRLCGAGWYCCLPTLLKR